MTQYEVCKIGPLIEEAFREALDLACQHPKIIYFRETQFHFEFAHKLLNLLSKKGYTPWEDLTIAFDTPHLNPEEVKWAIPVEWGRIADDEDDTALRKHIEEVRQERKKIYLLRPDIIISPLEINSDLSLWIEIKSLSNVSFDKSGKKYYTSSKIAYDTIEYLCQKRLRKLASSHSSSHRFFAIAVYYHESHTGHDNSVFEGFLEAEFSTKQTDEGSLYYIFKWIDPTAFWEID